MKTSGMVRMRDLDREEAEAVLVRNQVGRLAYTGKDRVEIVPIGYVYRDGVIVARTAPGMKLAALQHDFNVAFEVDEVETLFQWRSVIVHGRFEPLRPVGSEATEKAWERAVSLLSVLIPATLTPQDPVPHRWFVFRIMVDELTGRASTVVPDAV